MPKPSLMILDGDNRAALAIARDFGARGIKVFVGGHARLSRAFSSRFCAGSFVYPTDKGPVAMHEAVLAHVKKFKPDVLMPLFDRASLLVMEHEEEYRQFVRLIPMPGISNFKQMQDKEQLMLRARACGIPMPETVCPKNLLEVKRLAAVLPYPVIIKPRVSLGSVGIKLVGSPRELCELCENVYSSRNACFHFPEIEFDARRPLVQEYVDGAVLNFYGYFEDSKLCQSFMTQTLRSHPQPFGHSIAARSIKDDMIKEYSLALTKGLGWNGVIDIQYMSDLKHRQPKLIDANPRMWSTVEFAMVSGINFPDILYQRALGNSLPGACDYEKGKSFRWVLFDELAYLFRSAHKKNVFKEYLDFTDVSCEIAFHDPKPHLIQLMGLLCRLATQKRQA